MTKKYLELLAPIQERGLSYEAAESVLLAAFYINSNEATLERVYRYVSMTSELKGN